MSRRFVVGVAFFVGNGRVKNDEKGFLFFEGELVIDTGLCLSRTPPGRRSPAAWGGSALTPTGAFRFTTAAPMRVEVYPV